MSYYDQVPFCCSCVSQGFIFIVFTMDQLSFHSSPQSPSSTVYPWLHHHPLPFTIALDEAWRWPLAGPVSVGGVASLRQISPEGIADSKTLSPKKRNAVYSWLPTRQDNGELLYSSGFASASFIDTYGIIAALQKACLLAIGGVMQNFWEYSRQKSLLASPFGDDQLAFLHLEQYFGALKKTRSLSLYARLLQAIIKQPQRVIHHKWLLIDGNHTFWLDSLLWCRALTIIKGDQKNPLISLASIIAKVERDEYMKTLDRSHHYRYGFSTHKWYWTSAHRKAIQEWWLSRDHRSSFGSHTHSFKKNPLHTALRQLPNKLLHPQRKPWLLLHICCAPDLTRPLHRLKNYFHLYLFWYNPNIHPRREHDKRYEQFIKLVWLELWTYTIVEDWYDPKEFFRAMIEQKATIHPDLIDADDKTVLKKAWAMEEWSDRCNPCYAMRLDQAAKNAVRYGIPFFTSTLLISPKKKMDKLFRRGVEAELNNPWSKFLWFDFIKNNGYEQASKLTKTHGLWRQNYCGCGWTIPKAWEHTTHRTW